MKKENKRLYIEGNNGGDYLEIMPLGKNLLHLKVGNCCVVTIDCVVPVEFLTILLTESTMHETIQDIIMRLWCMNPDNLDFAKSLAAQVRENNYGQDT